MEQLQTNHQLHAIRLKWLRWLATPIIAIWNFVVDVAKYVWSLVTLAWQATKRSMNYRYWYVAAWGGTLGCLFLLLFWFIGIRTNTEELLYVGSVLSVLPFAWSYAEIANLLKRKEETGVNTNFKDIRNTFGNGLKAVKFLAMYVVVIVAMILLQVILDFIGMIPTVGTTFLGIFVIPLVVASVVVVFSILILWLGSPILGPHLLFSAQNIEEGFFKQFLNSSLSLVKMMSRKWIDILLVGLPAMIFATVISLIPILILTVAIGISIAIATGIAVDNADQLLRVLYSWGDPGFFDYLGGFFMLVSLSVLYGIAFSFAGAAFASTYYSVYRYESGRGLFKKICGVALMIVGVMIFLAPIFGVFFEIFGDLFGFGGGYYDEPSYYYDDYYGY
tara:strand:- start:151 stop:1320 length:1170 start_codon:yes stop_codon:yes gene_type:complete